MAVRLKDIAQDLGLSVVTVSKVLRDHPDISDMTRKRVLKRMKELHYQPNMAARSLITGRTWTIGLVVPDLLHPFFAEVANEISMAVRKKGYSLFISSSDEDPALEQQEIAQLLARRVDVLLIASSQQKIASFQRIEEQQIPYILLDRQLPGLDANFVGVDDCAVGLLATEHLIQQGCRRIAHIRGPEVSTAAGRLEGYRQALSGEASAATPMTLSRSAPPAIIAENAAGTTPRRSCFPIKPSPMESSASTILARWAPCAPSSMPACAFLKTLRWWVAATFPTPTFCASRLRQSIKAQPRLPRQPPSWRLKSRTAKDQSPLAPN